MYAIVCYRILKFVDYSDVLHSIIVGSYTYKAFRQLPHQQQDLQSNLLTVKGIDMHRMIDHANDLIDFANNVNILNK